jgi:adenylosuccinate lyase
MNTISPLDGRYNYLLKYYNNKFSEVAFVKSRVIFEIDYFNFLLKLNEYPFVFNDSLKTFMSELKNKVLNNFDNYFDKIKIIENKIKHDVKSIEYFLAEELENAGYGEYINLLHFGLTSQDVNTFFYSISIKNWYYDIFISLYDTICDSLTEKIDLWKNIIIMGRTHGQPATWTTLGKEFSVYLYKLNYENSNLINYKFTTKLGGAVGNLTSHNIFNKSYNWENLLQSFLMSNYELNRTSKTTQIHNYNEYSIFFDSLKRVCSILVDMCSDIWLYCSLGELTLKKPSSHVGSSIMPHKVNPIEFENAEGNLKIAIMWLEFLSRELCVSRLQRDLTDSTILRNLGVVFSHIHIGFKMIERGFTFLEPNKEKIEEILENNLRSMSEVDQHILRKQNNINGYNSVKNNITDYNKEDIEELKNKYKKYILESYV